MACCGKNRSTAPVETGGPPRVAVTAHVQSAQYFEYVGKTGLTALGPVTGRRYRFAHSGALLPIDERDAASMAGVPSLRRARAPE